MTLVELVAVAVSALALLQALFLFIQVAAASRRKSRTLQASGVRGSVAVLVPAHDEALGIRSTLATIRRQMAAGDRLVVVADNCSDDTARIAAACGAEVLARHDAARRGKGYALDWGIRHLERSPPDVVVIVDADCIVCDGAIERLARACLQSGRPAQALYLMRSAEDASPRSRLGELAWTVRNHVRPLGCHNLGMPCQLMGSGMALPWRRIGAIRLASGNIVEDLALGIDFACLGAPPLFCPEAVVTGRFPTARQAWMDQRKRWEHGHLGLMVSQVPRLIAKAIERRDIALVALALDLSVPPLALFAMLLGALSALGLTLLLATGSALPIGLAGAALTLLVASVAWAWARFARERIPLAALAKAPLYAIAKLPIYLSLGFRRQAEWVRSRRDGE